MAYRSELEAALARLEATREHGRPCPACEARATRHLRFAQAVLRLFVGVAGFVLMVSASLCGLIAFVGFLLGTLVLVTGGPEGPSYGAMALLVSAMFALASFCGFVAFAWCERRLAFDAD